MPAQYGATHNRASYISPCVGIIIILPFSCQNLAFFMKELHAAHATLRYNLRYCDLLFNTKRGIPMPKDPHAGRTARLMPNRLQAPVHIWIATAAFLLIACSASFIAFIGYKGNEHTLENLIQSHVEISRIRVQQTLESQILKPKNFLRLLRYSPLQKQTTLATRQKYLSSFIDILDIDHKIDAVHVGYPNGDFFLVRRIISGASIVPDTPANSRYLVQSIEYHPITQKPTGTYLFYDAQGHLIDQYTDPAYRYDPRSRPWYNRALQSADTILTKPYLFFTSQVPGITFAQQASAQANVVFGIDLSITDLSSLLKTLKVTPSTRVVVTDPQGVIYGTPDPNAFQPTRIPRPDASLDTTLQFAMLSTSHDALLQHIGRISQHLKGDYTIDGNTYTLSRIPLSVGNLNAWQLLLVIPHAELFSEVRDTFKLQTIIVLVLLALVIPLAWIFSKRLSLSIQRLTHQVQAVRAFQFDKAISANSRMTEVVMLENAVNHMRTTIQHFLDTSVSVSTEQDQNKLITIALTAMAKEAGVDDCVLYLRDTKKQNPATFHHAAQVGTYYNHLPQTLHMAQIPEDKALHICFTQKKHAKETIQDQCQQLILPLLGRDNTVTGIAYLKAPRPNVYFSQALIGYLNSLSSTVAIAIETRSLLQGQRKLLDAIIKLLATAIDAQSPHTAGHCKRVPELVERIVQAVEDTQHGTYADFKLSQNDADALHIAGWLHDCGKLVVPDHIVEKATKLECIYNRIHEIRMRFEVCKRDAHIQYLHAILDGSPPESAQATLSNALAALDDDFAFVAKLNEGGEFLSTADIKRLENIANRTWQRTLSDHIGLSQNEQSRMPAPAPLPTIEYILDDKPQHRIPFPASETQQKWQSYAFNVQQPSYKYNHGERYNLSIARGTLTAEERFLINDHMAQTIMMLDTLPFPNHLQNVAEYATAHHEHMNGTGYPRGLHKNNMSIPARCMAIADVFEALTATDRPYKKANTLSQAFKIMRNMAADEKLDTELLEIFIASAAPWDFASRHLQKQQIDLPPPALYNTQKQENANDIAKWLQNNSNMRMNTESM
jgi:HD-GYP domain-containing protein (c-di-GMP phosphodiesterase class II)